MKTIKIISLLAISAFFILPAHAQKGVGKIDVSYSAAYPTGSFKDFVSDGSYRGVDIKILFGKNDKLSVGFGTGFQDFYQKYPRQVYKLPDGSDVSAVVSNSLQTVPLLARAEYNFIPQNRVQPFVAAGVGGDLVLYRQYLGEFGDSKNKFAFQAQPEAGVFFPFRAGGLTGIKVSGYYNIIPFNYNGMGNLNNFGFKVGISFPTRSY